MKTIDIQKSYKVQIEEVVKVCRRAGELGYGASSGGNVSCRVEENLFLITPTHKLKREMTFDDICAVDGDGNVVFASEGRKPSGETSMHLHIFKVRPDVKAIMHAHPPLLIGMSLADMQTLMLPLLPEIMMEIGPIIKVPYAEPNSPELGYAFDPYINDSNGFVLESHGALACATNEISETAERVQMMESLAKSVLTAKVMGKKIRTLTEREIDGIDNIISAFHWRLPGAVGRYGKMRDVYAKVLERK